MHFCLAVSNIYRFRHGCKGFLQFLGDSGKTMDILSLTVVYLEFWITRLSLGSGQLADPETRQRKLSKSSVNAALTEDLDNLRIDRRLGQFAASAASRHST